MKMLSYLYDSIEVRTRIIFDLIYIHVEFFSFTLRKLTRMYNGKVLNSLWTTVMVIYMYIQILKP